MLVVVCCDCGCDDCFSSLTGRKVEIGPAKMANFSAFITKNASLDAPNVKRMPKIVIVLRFWTCLDIEVEGIDNIYAPVIIGHLSIGITTVTVIKYK
jgi:hypothetical protein